MDSSPSPKEKSKDFKLESEANIKSEEYTSKAGESLQRTQGIPEGVIEQLEEIYKGN
jgi:hypothetical protein